MRIFLCLIILMPLSVNATTTEWTGGASDHDWFNAANWNMGVPGLLDTAIVGTDSVNIAGVVDIKYLEVKDFARLVISPNGKLRILNSDDVALFCTKSTIYNYGLIRIFNPVDDGVIISSDSKIFNYMGADLFIESAGNNSVHINAGGELLNFPGANIQVDSCVSSLFNEGVMLNRGSVNINVTQNNGFVNNGNLTNEGVIKIDSTGLTAFMNNTGGIINNSDSLIISRVSNELPTVFPLLNSDSLKNMLGGVILIHESNNLYGLNTEEGGNTINDGSINIINLRIGILCVGGTFVNQGNIDILSTHGGMVIVATFINEEFGRIHMSSKDGVPTGGAAINLFNPGVLSNYGLVEINDSFRRGLEIVGGRINNYDSLNINMSNTFLLLENQDTIKNYTSGVLLLNYSNLSHGGLIAQNKNSGYIENEGVMHMSSEGNDCLLNEGKFSNEGLLTITTPSLALENNGLLFLNSVNGLVDIDNADEAIVNDSEMINYGTITIDSVGDTGLENTGILTNEGKISITNVFDIGVQNSGTLINKDSIVIDEIQEIGFLNMDSLYLDTNSVIVVSNTESPLAPNFIQNEGSLTNHGKITIDVMESSTTGGNGIHCLPSSFWFNSTSSELIVHNFDSIIDWVIIDVGAEFSDSGVITMD